MKKLRGYHLHHGEAENDPQPQSSTTLYLYVNMLCWIIITTYCTLYIQLRSDSRQMVNLLLCTEYYRPWKTSTSTARPGKIRVMIQWVRVGDIFRSGTCLDLTDKKHHQYIHVRRLVVNDNRVGRNKTSIVWYARYGSHTYGRVAWRVYKAILIIHVWYALALLCWK